MSNSTRREQAFDQYQQGALQEQLKGTDEVGFFMAEKEAPNLPEHAEITGGLNAEITELKEKLEQIRREIGQKEQLKKAVEHLPVLFDSPDFFTVREHLDELDQAGIQEVRIGERTYKLKEMQAMVHLVDDYAGEHMKPDDAAIDAYLAQLQITRQKVSAHSKYGFRDCMKLCIENDGRAHILDREPSPSDS